MKTFTTATDSEMARLMLIMAIRGRMEAEIDVMNGKYISVDFDSFEDEEYNKVEDRLMDIYFEVCNECGIEPGDTDPNPWDELIAGYVSYVNRH